MPIVEISLKDFNSLMGKNHSMNELMELVLFAKAEVEAVEGDLVKLDVKDTNRPDLWSTEGIVRELRAQAGKEKGLPKYSVKKSGVKAVVDPKLKNIRGKAAYAVVKNVKVTDELIKQMIQLQEKICLTFGRKRKEVAIGIFDFDRVHENVKYFAAEPGFKFVPLGYNSPLSLREILTKHPKGKEYGKLLEEFERFPLLIDSRNEVLSMPPIINSEESGKITEETRSLFVDVTGHNQELIDAALKVVCMALADRGGKIESVEISYGKKKLLTPSFGTKKIEVPLKELEEKSGMQFSRKQVTELLKKKRMEGAIGKNRVLVKFPDYRTDIIHAVDVIEDLLIAFDYNRIDPLQIQDFTLGQESKEAKRLDSLKETCVGMGLQEVLTFVLSSKEIQEKRVGLKEQEFVGIKNPVSLNWSVFRRNLFPELLNFLAKNKHNLFPQRIFEVGKAVHLDSKSETRVLERNRLCIASSHSNANFNEVKSMLQALAQTHGWKFKLEALKHSAFEDGKCGALSINGRKGILGEVKESILQNFGLEKRVAVLELEV